jgi:alanine dehydrogenase
VPNTSTRALSNQTLRYALALAADPLGAMRADRVLARGLNTFRGQLTHVGVAEAFDLPAIDPLSALAA